MPIETICPGCSRKLRVSDDVAGQQARCPVCHEIYTVRANPASASDPPADATWRLKTPEGQIYGPVSKEELDQWVTDGRVTADCHVAASDGQWDPADHRYPVLQTSAQRAPIVAASGRATPPEPRPATPFAAGGSSAVSRRYRYTAPHRGGLILALGVISWVVGCPIFGLFAWVMGSGDLREMRAGRMDPSGIGLTQAGQIIGMIHSILVILALVAFVFIALMAAVMN